MQRLLEFVQSNKLYFDAAHALSSLLSVVGWTVGLALLFAAWRRNSIESVTVGPINFQMRQEAVAATVAAARNWEAQGGKGAVDVERARQTVERAFEPAVADKLVGRSILWADDNPQNNLLAVRAFRKLGIEIEQVLSTEVALAELGMRHYDLIISDMGRGPNMRAGYELLEAVRARGDNKPFMIFAGADRPEFRAEAQKRGAQLSTNDMLELIDVVVKQLSQS